MQKSGVLKRLRLEEVLAELDGMEDTPICASFFQDSQGTPLAGFVLVRGERETAFVLRAVERAAAEFQPSMVEEHHHVVSPHETAQEDVPPAPQVLVNELGEAFGAGELVCFRGEAEAHMVDRIENGQVVLEGGRRALPAELQLWPSTGPQGEP